MVVLFQSQTCPINPPGAQPVLTTAQFWEVMILKCRQPELFVAPMSSSEVLEETETFIKRVVVFKEVSMISIDWSIQLILGKGMGPPSGKATEDITLKKPWKADFVNLDSGAFISNLVSQGKDETDLYLTFYFEWKYPNIEQGSKEEKETSDRLWGMAGKTVQHTIDYARNMAREGKLGKA